MPLVTISKDDDQAFQEKAKEQRERVILGPPRGDFAQTTNTALETRTYEVSEGFVEFLRRNRFPHQSP